jgi:dephospho-CoA kinase
MVKSRKKPVIGILGGIASGKSTVAAEFARLGCAVIDADKIAHQLLSERQINKEIIELFGNKVLDGSGDIDRHKLAAVVFSDAERLARLNELIHPPTLAEADRLIEHYNSQPDVKAIVLDMPLLAEVGWEKRCDRLIFVDCKEQKRLERAKKIGIFDENELKIRENFQISLYKKVKLCDNTIDNNSGFSALARQAKEIFTKVIENW